MKRYISKVKLLALVLILGLNHLSSIIVYKDNIIYDYENDRYYANQVYDFSKINRIRDRKKLFCDFMYLIIESENKEIISNREKILALREKKSLTQEQVNFINNIEKVYKLDISEYISQIDWDRMLKRVDIVPKELAISQTAVESGWGTSVFAKKANNMFGHWTYKVGTGLVPTKRDEGQTHEIAVFDSVNDSVKKYMLNLNTNKAYTYFRDLRCQLRKQGEKLDAEVLSSGLINYSGIGEDYIRMIRLIIKDVSRYWRKDD